MSTLPKLEVTRAMLVDEDGQSFWGKCSYCETWADNRTANHRVTGIMQGGRGVECLLRGDIESQEAAPLAVARRTEEER